ncbi:MAG: hypothetical protein AAF570_19435, partial [Bacteroidota bacterium]
KYNWDQEAARQNEGLLNGDSGGGLLGSNPGDDGGLLDSDAGDGGLLGGNNGGGLLDGNSGYGLLDASTSTLTTDHHKIQTAKIQDGQKDFLIHSAMTKAQLNATLQRLREQAQYISQLCDNIPSPASGKIGGGITGLSGNRISDAYEIWFHTIQIPFNLPNKNELRLQEAAIQYCQAHYASYSEFRLKYQKALLAYNTAKNNFESAEVVSAHQMELEDALQNWQVLGQKTEFEKQFAIYKTLTRGGIAEVLANAVDRYNLVKQAHKANGENFLPVTVGNGTADPLKGGWKSFTFNFHYKMNDSEGTSDKWKANACIPIDEGPFCLNIGDSGSRTKVTDDIDKQDFTVTMSYKVVPISRDAWFYQSLVTSRYWRFQPNLGGDLSTGTALSDTHDPLMPMIPTAMVLVDNVTVKFSESAYKYYHTFFHNHFNAGISLLGLIPLGGVSEDHTHKHTRTTWNAQKSTLTANGSAIAGFICEVLPKLPNAATTDFTGWDTLDTSIKKYNKLMGNKITPPSAPSSLSSIQSNGVSFSNATVPVNTASPETGDNRGTGFKGIGSETSSSTNSDNSG